MSDPKRVEPDEDLLEFLGGIDEVNEDSNEAGFTDFLAKAEIDRPADKAKAPPKENK